MAAAIIETAPSRLLSAPVNLSALREDAWRELVAILESLDGRIIIVLDPHLEAALKLVVTGGAKAMREFRVDGIMTLDDATLSTDADTVLYICRPLPRLMRLVASQVQAFTRRGLRKACHCALSPRRTFLCENILKELGVLAASSGLADTAISAGGGASGTVSLGEYSGFEILPVDDDILVLNNDTVLTDVAVNGDTAPLYAVTQALLKLQAVYGPFSNIRAKGPMAGAVVDLMLRLRREMAGAESGTAVGASAGAGGEKQTPVTAGAPAGTPAAAAAAQQRIAGFNLATAVADTRTYIRSIPLSSAASGDGGGGAVAIRGEIDTCIVLDRLTDLVTPLMTSLTYESLLDESALGPVTCGMVTLDTALVVDPQETPAQPEGAAAATKGAKPAPVAPPLPPRVTLHLNSNAKLYAELRDCNIQKAGPRLGARAREMQALRDSVTKSRATDLAVSDIRRFVKQIPGLQADMRLLRLLINVTEPLKRVTDEPAFLERWQLERSIVDEDNKQAAYDAIAAAVARQQPLLPTLRLMCLQAAVEGGLRAKQIEPFRRALVHAYGCAVLPALRALECTWLLREREASVAEGLMFGAGAATSGWTALRRGFGLTADRVDVAEPADLHYVTSGYAPLSVRLVQAALALPAMPALTLAAAGGSGASGGAGSSGPAAVTTGVGGAAPASPGFAGSGGAGWLAPGVSELLKLLPGPVWHVTCGSGGASAADTPAPTAGAGAPSAGAAASAASVAAAASAGAGVGAATDADGGAEAAVAAARRVVLVVYVGGVTFSELSGLRFVAERAPVDFIVLATAVTSGNKMLEGMLTSPALAPLLRVPAGARLAAASSAAAAVAAAPPPASAPAPAAAATPSSTKPATTAGRR